MAKRTRRAGLDGLTYKQQRFVQEFVRHGNVTAASRTAGYSHRSAQQIGSEMLLNPVIQAAILAEREEMRQACRATREDLLAELLTIALGDPGDVVTIANNDMKLKSGKQMGRARRTIQSITITETAGEFGTSRSNKVSFHNKQGAINDVWEKLGFGNLDPARDRGAFLGAIRGALGKVKPGK